jgi:DNA-binding MarR family transcriptional regulator
MRVQPKDVVDRLFELAIALQAMMDSRLAANGLTPARAEVMWLLGQSGAVTQRELARLLECSPRNVTGLVDALEDRSMVARIPHPTDRRAHHIVLTDAGQRIVDGWNRDRQEGTARILGGISAADLAIFDDVLQVVLARLQAASSPGNAVSDTVAPP